MLSHFNCVCLFVTPWIRTCWALLPMKFSWQEYSSGLPCPPPKDLPDPRIKLASPTGRFFTTKPWEAIIITMCAVRISLQWCPTLCGRMNSSLRVSSVHGISQAGILERLGIPFSKGYSWPRDQTWASCIASRFFSLWATRETQIITIIITISKLKLSDSFLAIYFILVHFFLIQNSAR